MRVITVFYFETWIINKNQDRIFTVVPCPFSISWGRLMVQNTRIIDANIRWVIVTWSTFMNSGGIQYKKEDIFNLIVATPGFLRYI